MIQFIRIQLGDIEILTCFDGIKFELDQKKLILGSDICLALLGMHVKS